MPSIFPMTQEDLDEWDAQNEEGIQEEEEEAVTEGLSAETPEATSVSEELVEKVVTEGISSETSEATMALEESKEVTEGLSLETPEATMVLEETVESVMTEEFPERLTVRSSEETGVELRSQVAILKENWEEMKSALVSWGKQVKQMFFHPEYALEELICQIKRHWSIPRKFYWLQINGPHESQVTELPKESSVIIKV
jgi:hypothetical protein